jgi:ABC-2 type transport system ATP-binding protein
MSQHAILWGVIHFRNLLSDLGGERTILLSTHIVEDIAQTCRNLAILKNGRVVFQGTTGDLIGEARGRVWIVTSQGQRPTGNITIVSTLHMGDSVQYRVVGELDKPGADGVAPTEPSLEDSYVWLMREQRALAAERP